MVRVPPGPFPGRCAANRPPADPPLKKVYLVANLATLVSRLLLAGLLGGFVACSDPEPEPPPVLSGVATGSVCPSESKLTYDSWASGFFASYCTRCHSTTRAADQRNGAPVGYNWDDIDSVRAHQAQIDLMAAASMDVVNHEMPPSDPRPATSERQKLGEWLACDAP
jgi:hypothetical protein